MTFDVVLISFNTRYLILGLKIQSSTGSRVHGLKIYLFKTSPMASIDRQSSKKRLTRLVQLKQGTLTRLFRCEFCYRCEFVDSAANLKFFFLKCMVTEMNFTSCSSHRVNSLNYELKYSCQG